MINLSPIRFIACEIVISLVVNLFFACAITVTGELRVDNAGLLLVMKWRYGKLDARNSEQKEQKKTNYMQESLLALIMLDDEVCKSA